MRSRTALAAAALVGALALTGCGAVDNAVEGLVNEGVEQVQGGVEGLIGEALGGVDVSTDGTLPGGFPAAEVPLVGEVRGGATGPDSSGWVVQTTLADASEFEAAAAALEGAGYTPSAVNSDATSGFGTFTGSAYTVVLNVAADGGATVATYVVTPAGQ